jgi:hypothetical protein
MQALLPELARTAPTAYTLTLFPLLAVCRASEALRLKREHGDFIREIAHFPETKKNEVFPAPEPPTFTTSLPRATACFQACPRNIFSQNIRTSSDDCEREQYGGLDS